VQSCQKHQLLPAMALSVGIFLAAVALPSPALGQDLNAALSNAESKAASAEAEIGQAQARVGPAAARYKATSKRAQPAQQAAAAARLRMRGMKAAIAVRRRSAAAQVARIESEHRSEVAEHDEAVRGGIDLALAALLAAAIALGWGWFRASAAVAWLTRVQLGQAIGLCLGGGFVLFLVGAAIAGAGGLTGVLGVFIALTGPVFAVAFLLARHSAEVQSGREKPLLRRERAPQWLMRGLAGLLGVICLAGLASAIFASGPGTEVVSAQVRSEASGTVGAARKRRLAVAETKTAALGQQASRRGSKQSAAQAVLRKARQGLGAAKSRLAAAEQSARSYSHQIEVAYKQEVREREKEEAKAQIEAEKQAEREAEEAEEESEGEECDPNYAGACLKPNVSDYDCIGGSGNGPYYTGEVTVVGVDHYGLDANGNGIGCEGE
jgi:hypothetical protein